MHKVLRNYSPCGDHGVKLKLSRPAPAMVQEMKTAA